MFNCLFLPGLPGSEKDYLFLNDIKLAGGKVYWQTYIGSYAKKDEGVFSYDNCLADIELSILDLENKGEPYIIMAYSFSTLLIRGINHRKLVHCEAIFCFSPILSLVAKDIKSNFNELLDGMFSDGDMNYSKDSWAQTIKVVGGEDMLLSWLKGANEYCMPTFLFSSADDESALSQPTIAKLSAPFLHKGSSVRFFQPSSVSHKIDSYYESVARSYLWAIISKILIKQAIGIDCNCYIWGSLLDSFLWTKHSDIDMLLIANFTPANHKKLAKVLILIEELSGIHLGLSLNEPDDLKRKSYIRRNRGSIFIHELSNEAISLGPKVALPNVTQKNLKKDSININKILRAEIEKQLLKYCLKPDVAINIIKSFLQSYRISQYSRGYMIADFSNINHEEKWLKDLVVWCIETKRNNYRGVDIDNLFDIYRAIDCIVEIREGLVK